MSESETERKPKYKPGDKVRVREWDDMEAEYGLSALDFAIEVKGRFTCYMSPCCGHELTVLGTQYVCKIGTYEYTFVEEGRWDEELLSEEMLVPVKNSDIEIPLMSESEQIKPRFSVGDKIRIRDVEDMTKEYGDLDHPENHKDGDLVLPSEVWFSREMYVYTGQEYTISGYEEYGKTIQYFLAPDKRRFDPGCFIWTEEMLASSDGETTETIVETVDAGCEESAAQRLSRILGVRCGDPFRIKTEDPEKSYPYAISESGSVAIHDIVFMSPRFLMSGSMLNRVLRHPDLIIPVVRVKGHAREIVDDLRNDTLDGVRGADYMSLRSIGKRGSFIDFWIGRPKFENGNYVECDSARCIASVEFRQEDYTNFRVGDLAYIKQSVHASYYRWYFDKVESHNT